MPDEGVEEVYLPKRRQFFIGWICRDAYEAVKSSSSPGIH